MLCIAVSIFSFRQYAKFIAMIRENLETMKPDDAVKKAVNDCIELGVLGEFLRRNKARVIKMSIYEYDEKKQRRLDREEGIEDGGCLKLIVLTQKKVVKGKTLDVIADELETTVDEIRPIYDVVIRYPVDTDPKEILASLNL